MIKKGVYAASLSVLNDDHSLDVNSTISHGASLIKNGLHGVFFFGSTGQSQLISLSEKKELISKAATHRLKNSFFFGTGTNSLRENIDLIKYAFEYDFKDFLIMPPAYYKGNTDEGVFDFYSKIISSSPKIRIVLYNFEKLSGYKFSEQAVRKLVQNFPKNIIGCKDSSYNLYEKLKLSNFLIFPGSETKLLKGLEIGNAGIISAVTNVTHSLARKVYDDFENKNKQSANEKLIKVRETFDNYDLISSLHSFMSLNDKKFKNLLPPLMCLKSEKLEELKIKLKDLKFILEKRAA